MELHPILIHFPIALLIVTLIFDLLNFWKNDIAYENSGSLCHLFGIITLFPALISGIIDNQQNNAGFLHFPENLMDFISTHGVIEIIAMGGFVGLLYWKLNMKKVNNYSQIKYYLIIYLICVLVMSWGAYLGSLYYH